MVTFLLMISLAVNGVLLWRLLRLRVFLSELASQLERRLTYLFVRPGRWADRLGLARLVSVTTALLAESERSTQQSRSYLQQIETTLSHLAEAVFITDEQRRVVLANQAARSLLELDNSYQGLRMESVIPSAEFFDLMECLRAGTAPNRRTVEIIRGRKHQHFEVAASLFPHAEAPGETLAIFILHDITRMVELERVRRDFVANVSHELRTPVTVIKGFSEALLDEGDDVSPENQRIFLEKIRRNTIRLNALLEDLLMLSRLESGRQKAEWEPVYLPGLVQELTETLQERGLAPGVKILVDLAAETHWLELDPLKIHQVLQNLCDNALRYAKGMTKLTIAGRREGQHLILSVGDDGCGVPENDLPHLFERFYRVDKGRSREHGGTGLGLSIVRHIISLHGGDSTISSRLGEGTTVILRLPFRPAETGLRPLGADFARPGAEFSAEGRQPRDSP